MKKILFFIFLFFYTNVYANPATTQLTQLLSTIQTLQADFTQTLSNLQSKQTLQQSFGHVILQQPGKFRWEVKKPVEQLIVGNGKRLWIYDPELEQVTIRSLTQEIGETPAFLLSNPRVALEKNFHVQAMKNVASLQWFLLTPKNRNTLFVFIKIGFLKSQIREMDLQDHLGHNTVIEFYNVISNQPLASSLFNFKLPRHVDVIDETRL
ncbi:MAG: lolA [Gammaproteobacteria bacterium]|jgi:outer membrane lipoprotein carrier protein|nr:lolA [Gammaproteobacteria bacterium]